MQSHLAEMQEQTVSIVTELEFQKSEALFISSLSKDVEAKSLVLAGSSVSESSEEQ